MLSTDPVRRRLALGAGLASLVLAVSACASSGSSSAPATSSTAESTGASESAGASSAEGPTVTITSTSSFGADEVTVPAGQTLTVINDSGFPHTFTEGENGTPVDNPRVNEQIAPDATVPVAFPEPGDYNITCTIHHNMNLVVHAE